MPTGASATTAGLRLEDIRTFLAIYENAKNLPPENRKTFQAIFEVRGRKQHTTTVGRLSRIIEFFFDQARAYPGPGFDPFLFYRREKGEPYEPTEAADELYKRFSMIARLCDEGREVVREISRRSHRLPVVRIGTTRTFGLLLLPFAFSNWGDRFNKRIDLRVEIANSNDLMPRLAGGLLDFVLAYGPENDHYQQRDPSIQFHSVGYKSRMILLCPVKGKAYRKRDGKNINENYDFEKLRRNWGAVKTKVAGGKPKKSAKSFYDDLRAVDLHELDPGRTTLIVTPSWYKPHALNEAIDLWRARGTVRDTASLDESLALVRAGLGIAHATEIFVWRQHVHIFKLVPEPDYAWRIGIYRSNSPLRQEAQCIASFIEDYFRRFEEQIRLGMPPAYDARGYVELCCKLETALDVGEYVL